MQNIVIIIVLVIIIMDEETFNKITTNIRNMRKLTNEEKQSIECMNLEQLKEIILLYDYLMEYMMDYLDKHCK